jgi:hypothetical protein
MSLYEIRAALRDHEVMVETASSLLAEANVREITPDRQEFLLGLAAYELQRLPLAYEHLVESQRLRESSETAARLALTCWRLNRLDEA